MDDALQAGLCRTMLDLKLAVQATQSIAAPMLVEWQRWAKAFAAGRYRRQNAERAALSARSEADRLELDDPAAGQLGRAAAHLAWAAVYAAAGEHEQAEALAHAARARLAAQLVPAAVARTIDEPTAREPGSGRGPSAAGARDADPATHARLLTERYGSTVAAEMTALYADMTGTEHWRSVSAKIRPRPAR